jgi:tetratricopeptide (TPR) repeat protein
MRAIGLALSLLLFAPLAGAQQFASLDANALYTRSMSYTQTQFSKVSGDQEIIKAQLAAALAELKSLRDRANAQDQGARTVLAAFGAGDTAKGVDGLMAQAAAKAQGSAEDYKAAGALAFAVDTNRAIAAYEAALKLAPSDPDVLHQLEWLYERQGRFAEALVLASRLALNADPNWKTRGLLDKGNVLRRQGDLDGSDVAQKAALDIATRAGLKLRQAQALGNLGVIAERRGNLAAAEDYQKRSLALNTELGRKQGMAATLTNLGVVAIGRNDLVAAEDYQKRAVALYGEAGDKDGQTAALANLGMIYYRRNNISAGCEYWRKSVTLAESIGAGGGQYAAYSRGNIAAHCQTQ